MDNKKKKEPWRIAAFSISVLVIVVLWSKKDIASMYQVLPREQLAPFIVTTLAVSFFKILVIAGAVLLIRWLVGKRKK